MCVCVCARAYVVVVGWVGYSCRWNICLVMMTSEGRGGEGRGGEGRGILLRSPSNFSAALISPVNGKTGGGEACEIWVTCVVCVVCPAIRT